MSEIRDLPLLCGLRITFSQVRGFVTVASTCSFTRAAEVLHLSQPALTTRIRQLEEALELRLFDRNARSVELTEAGRELLPVFMRLVDDLETAVVSAKDHAERAYSIIRLACLPSCAATLLPDLIHRFRADWPEATFVVEDAMNNQVRSLVRDGQVGFGICAVEADDRDLTVDGLLQDNLQVVHPPGHPLAAIGKVTVAELARYPLVLTSRGSSIRHMVEHAFTANGLTAAPAFEVNYMSTSIALVQAGLGIAILPSTAVELRSPGVAARGIDDPEFTRTLALVRRKEVPLRRIAEAFAQMILAQISPGDLKTYGRAVHGGKPPPMIGAR